MRYQTAAEMRTDLQALAPRPDLRKSAFVMSPDSAAEEHLPFHNGGGDCKEIFKITLIVVLQLPFLLLPDFAYRYFGKKEEKLPTKVVQISHWGKARMAQSFRRMAIQLHSTPSWTTFLKSL